MAAQQRAAALVISVMAGTCMLLSGCGGNSSSSGGSPANSANGPVSGGAMQPVGATPGTGVKLTGHFCTDFKNIGRSISVPASAMGSLADLRKHGAQYLDQAAAYFNNLAAEAPPQESKELRVVASDYQAMAASIASGNIGSLAKIEQRMVSLTTKGASGNAFRRLVTSMAIKCMAA